MDNKRINVVILHSSFCIGGAENMVYELAKSFDPKSVNATVITISSRLDTSLEEKVEKAGIKVIYAGCQGRITPQKILRIYRLIKQCKPDIIHAHMGGVVYGLLWICTHKTKMFVTAHTTPDKAFNARTTVILKRFAYLHKIIMVAVSEENRRLMAEQYHLADDAVKYVNNGVDLTRYYKAAHEDVVFINVGRHDKNKNQATIIRLFAKVHEKYNNTRLILCGDGPEHNAMMKLVSELKLRDYVEFPGNVGNVQDYLARSDIYIQASHREGLPLSTIEAMASQLPVISTDVGGMKNIVVDNGYLVKDNDEEALLSAMNALTADKETRMDMGLKSLKIASGFSAESMADKYERLYRKEI